jgi:hypothetical protein
MTDEVNQYAVDNFLSSVKDSDDQRIHFANLLRDAKGYNWNAATIFAIWDGIERIYGTSTFFK